MRRDATSVARPALEYLTQGRMDPSVIRYELSFALRVPSGQRLRTPHSSAPNLSLVSEVVSRCVRPKRWRRFAALLQFGLMHVVI